MGVRAALESETRTKGGPSDFTGVRAACVSGGAELLEGSDMPQQSVTLVTGTMPPRLAQHTWRPAADVDQPAHSVIAGASRTATINAATVRAAKLVNNLTGAVAPG